MTPLLILLFGIHPVAAVGTDLLYAAATKSVGTLVHGFTHTVDWQVVRRLATGSVPMAILTLVVLSFFDLSGELSARPTSRALGAALLVTALALVFGASLLAYVSTHIPISAPAAPTPDGCHGRHSRCARFRSHQSEPEPPA